ncbi:type II toxin-antitoxin system HicB family antitoxin [Halalkalibacter alkalisediminis]|uniref:Type II toxin-antitoxin system HicB family antitoxin n=1 Tax=Halalkalibacter alkalisediminis TaxID=935616 RepID=A0ABV6NMW9_9BACI|nr:type II toxin-antitoxin system HicB family antitoxin [Halalkalibacter alkalisediminis]
MLDSESNKLEHYQLDDFTWRVRKVFNWSGDFEVMIEIEELDGCVSFGKTVKEAKADLAIALRLWVQFQGEQLLPDIREGAHIVYLDPPMDESEFDYINDELQRYTE